MSEPNLDQKKWLQEGKAKAPELRARAREAAKEMFASGDISEFLNILSRFNNYDAYNLILILLQYPKARVLAVYNFWKRLIDNPTAKILKPEWVGKGIDLVIPFTEISELNEHKLIWFATRQFDISQTNAVFEAPQSAYIYDALHSEILVKSLCETIIMEYHRSVFHIGSDAAMKAAGMPGKLSDNTVSIRDDLKPVAKLDWLIDCLCVLQGGEDNIPLEYKELFRQCLKYAFWKKWSLMPLPSLYAYKKTIQEMEDVLQMEFFDQVIRTFRSLDESIQAAYVSSRKELESGNTLEQLNKEIWNVDLKPFD